MVCVLFVHVGLISIEIFVRMFFFSRVNEKVKINIIHQISTGENIHRSMLIKAFMLSVNVHGNSIEEFSLSGRKKPCTSSSFFH